MPQQRDLDLEAALIPDYVTNETVAKEAIKAVLGVLASKLSEENVREFVELLPEYLAYENLRRDRENPTPATPKDCRKLLKKKLEITDEQAQELMLKIIKSGRYGEQGTARRPGKTPQRRMENSVSGSLIRFQCL